MTQDQLPAEAARAEIGADPDGPQWAGPMRLWQLYLLIFSTVGVYLFFWAARVAKDLRANLDPKVRPWRHVVGLLIGFGYPFVAYRLTSLVDRLSGLAGIRTGPPPWVVVIVTLATMIGIFASDRSDDPRHLAFFLGLVAAVAIVPIPWLLVQRKLNAYKRGLPDVAWRTPPDRLTGRHFAALSVGALCWAGLALLVIADLDRQLGDPLPAGSEVWGDSGLFSVTPGDASWVRVPSGTIEVGTDLELYGASSETWLLAYVNTVGNQAIDDLVHSRRTMVRGDYTDFAVDEERVLLAETGVPVSFARYNGWLMFLGEQETWWVATLAVDGVTIEVLARAPGGPAENVELERIVKSLGLKRER